MDLTNTSDIYSIHAAAPLDYLHSECLSGYFDLELVARSPLLVGKQTEDSAKNHWLEVQKVNGKPFISPTMIKGLLSTTYERLTSSRFRIFDTSTHSNHLTYRTDPSQSLSLTPVLYTGTTDNNQNHTFKTLDGSPSRDGKPAYIPIKYNKRVLGGRYKLKSGYTKELIKQFRHGDHVVFKAYRIKRRWIVTTISKIDRSYTLHVGTFQYRKNDSRAQDPREFTGYLYITSPNENLKKNRTNFDTKWAERIFIEKEVGDKQIRSQDITCDQSVFERYHAVLSSYAKHQEAADKLQERRKNPKATNNIFSRAAEEERTLKIGDLAYALLDANKQVSELVPITVGRHAYSHVPNEIAEQDGVLPARILEDASAAERLFGFVGCEDSNGSAALRGRIQIGPVTVSDDPIETPPVGDYTTLPPLLSPKPSSGRRFLVARKGFPRTTGNGLRRDTLFDPSVSSLGEAAYPTHRSALNKSLVDIIAACDANRDTSKDSDSVRLRVRSWLKPGTTLCCRVYFEDVSAKELAFLLWPLVPENLTPDGCTGVGYHKIGIGKPLGLGLVEVRVQRNAINLQEAGSLVSAYAALSGVLGSTVLERSVDSLIDKGAIGSLDELPWIRAFRRIAYGFDDGLPVRYVNLEENKRNNKTDKNGNPNEGCGLAPRPLWHKSAEEGYVDHFRGSGCTKRQTNKSPGKKKRHANGNGDEADQNRHRSKQGRRYYRKSRGR